MRMEFPADGKGGVAVNPFYSKRTVVLVQCPPGIRILQELYLEQGERVWNVVNF